MENLSETLASAVVWLNIIFGILLFVCGLIGNCGNIYVFSKSVYRKTNVGIYLLLASIASMVQLIHTLLPRILSDGFQVPIVQSNERYCQSRFIISGVASSCGISYTCWASFDQYICTSRNAIRRTRWNSKRSLCQSIIFTAVVWLIIFLPGGILSKPLNGNCIISNRMVSRIYSYAVVPISYCLLPTILLLYFNYGLVKNLCHAPVVAVTNTSKRMARQVHRMLVPQLIILILSGLPFMSQTLYSTGTASIRKSQERLAIENLISHLTRLLFYLNYVSSFYVHMCTSNEFRKIIIDRRMRERD